MGADDDSQQPEGQEPQEETPGEVQGKEEPQKLDNKTHEPMDVEAGEADREGEGEGEKEDGSGAGAGMQIAVGVGVFLRLVMFHLIDGVYPEDVSSYRFYPDEADDGNRVYISGCVIAIAFILPALALYAMKGGMPLLGLVGLIVVGWFLMVVGVGVLYEELLDPLIEERENYMGLIVAGIVLLITFQVFSFGAACAGVAMKKNMTAIAAVLACLGIFFYSLIAILVPSAYFRDEFDILDDDVEDGYDCRIAGGAIMLVGSLASLGAAGGSMGNKALGRISAIATVFTIIGFIIATAGYGLINETAYDIGTDTVRYLIIAEPLTAFFMLITTAVTCFAVSM